MNMPMSTGQVLQLLDVPEHKLTSLVRLGKMKPVKVFCGRRLWTFNEVMEAAKLLGKPTYIIRQKMLNDE
jgi:hypothetical protein